MGTTTEGSVAFREYRTDVFEDLEAEQDRLEGILEQLDQMAWLTASGAAGWSIADMVLHLAQIEEQVVASAAGRDEVGWDRAPGTLDEFIERWVRAERAGPDVVFARWRKARRDAERALRQADPRRRLAWSAAPLRPQALATTRLAEHWAHGLDITGPLGILFPDTERLRHIAWLAHRSLPYAFALAGEEPHDVYCELTAHDGSTWRYGPAEATSTITGSAGDFCRVGARRLAPEQSGLVAGGPTEPPRYGSCATTPLDGASALTGLLLSVELEERLGARRWIPMVGRDVLQPPQAAGRSRIARRARSLADHGAC